MGDRLSSGPVSLCVLFRVCLYHQPFINSSALLISLIALQLEHIDQKTFWPCSSFLACHSLYSICKRDFSYTCRFHLM